MTPQRLRVAWLGHKSPQLGGGIATYSKEVTDGLRRRGVQVVLFHHGVKTEIQDHGTSVEAVALEAVPLMKALVFSPPRAKRQLVDRLGKREFDLVHASFWFSSLDFDLPKVCHAQGVPIIATFHVAFDQRRSLWGGITSATYRLYAPVLAECDRVIVFSDTQRAILADLDVPERVLTVIPNGVDVDKYRPGESDFKQRLSADRLFVYMGRIDSEKNVGSLLDAFMASRLPDGVHLAVVGGGSERRLLQRLYRDPRIHFLGHIADEQERISILRAADAFFLPSSVEGLSLSMLEAMACGAATVATDVGSDGDALRGAGIVIDPQNLTAELGLSIRLLLELPGLAAELGRAARERVLERFSLAGNVDTLVDLYQEVVAGGARLASRAGRS